jgi:hypothetical protein
MADVQQYACLGLVIATVLVRPRPDRREFPQKRTVAPSFPNNRMQPVRTMITNAYRLPRSGSYESNSYRESGCSENLIVRTAGSIE